MRRGQAYWCCCAVWKALRNTVRCKPRRGCRSPYWPQAKCPRLCRRRECRNRPRRAVPQAPRVRRIPGNRSSPAYWCRSLRSRVPAPSNTAQAPLSGQGPYGRFQMRSSLATFLPIPESCFQNVPRHARRSVSPLLGQCLQKTKWRGFPDILFSFLTVLPARFFALKSAHRPARLFTDPFPRECAARQSFWGLMPTAPAFEWPRSAPRSADKYRCCSCRYWNLRSKSFWCLFG